MGDVLFTAFTIFFNVLGCWLLLYTQAIEHIITLVKTATFDIKCKGSFSFSTFNYDLDWISQALCWLPALNSPPEELCARNTIYQRRPASWIRLVEQLPLTCEKEREHSVPPLAWPASGPRLSILTWLVRELKNQSSIPSGLLDPHTVAVPFGLDPAGKTSMSSPRQISASVRAPGSCIDYWECKGYHMHCKL